MPSILTSPRALPFRFRRQRVLIVGYGDIGVRVARLLKNRVHVMALTRDSERLPSLREQGVTPILVDLDVRSTLLRLAGWAQRVLHLAPPPASGEIDVRMLNLLRVLSVKTAPIAMVYVSTTGVYGDCAGAWVPETRAPRPVTPRALRRLDAERRVRGWGRRAAVAVSVLRVPGIYGVDRDGGTPWSRLRKGLPVLNAAEDVYTNHIQADDLARACLRALWLGRAQRVYNANDDTSLKMGDYLDWAADLVGLDRPVRASWDEIGQILSPMQLSFMTESRRMRNGRMKRELRLALRYPTVEQGLRMGDAQPTGQPRRANL